MLNIFTFTDYRKFLASYYENKKAESPAFSYQNFGRKAGFTSKSAVLNVIKGRKNLSKASSLQIAEAMGLGKREAAYSTRSSRSIRRGVSRSAISCSNN